MALEYHSYDEILQNSLNTLTSYTAITQLTPGSKARSILEIISKEIGLLAQSFDLELAQAFVRTANGDSLDLIGELVGITRIEAQKANVNAATGNIRFYVISGTFGDINGGTNIFIPSGTVLSAKTKTGSIETSIDYITLEDVTLQTADTETYVSAISSGTGAEFSIGANSINSHNFTSYTDTSDNSLKVTNVDGIIGGFDREDDGNYRYRLSQAVIASEAANETAVRLATLSVAGVSNIVLVPYDRGTGSFSVYIKSIYPVVSNALINQVQNAIDRIQSYGNKGIARSPKNVGIELTATISYRESMTNEEKNSIVAQASEVIADYLNNLEIGEEFVVQELIQKILDIDDRIKRIGTNAKPLDELYIYRDSRLNDNRTRKDLLGDYVAYSDERVLVEYSIANPIVIRSL